MLDPMAIALMPPEFDAPAPSRIQELKLRLERTVLGGNDDGEDEDGGGGGEAAFAPKGSLV